MHRRLRGRPAPGTVSRPASRLQPSGQEHAAWFPPLSNGKRRRRALRSPGATAELDNPMTTLLDTWVPAPVALFEGSARERGGPAMKITRTGSAAWQGGIKDGKGSLSTESGALKAYPYGFASRFEGQRGSNPEELIAAAHASCFTMALSLMLSEAKLTAEQMNTSAEVTLEQVEGGFAITAVHLTLKAKIPGADQATFEKLAAKAKAGCPVSKLLKAEITLEATLLS